MLTSGLPDTVADDEDLARFLTQSSHFTSIGPKPAAFLPSPKSRETSVSRHGSYPLESLWTIGLQAAGDRKLYGAAIFKARAVRMAQLDIVADEPPPRHAAIKNWPLNDADPEMEKAAQKEKAAVIASEATLVMR